MNENWRFQYSLKTNQCLFSPRIYSTGFKVIDLTISEKSGTF